MILPGHGPFLHTSRVTSSDHAQMIGYCVSDEEIARSHDSFTMSLPGKVTIIVNEGMSDDILRINHVTCVSAQALLVNETK
jgi:hypothetical protein